MAKCDETSSDKVAQSVSSKPVTKRQVSWNDIGDGFEALGKVGLALAIGMSAAGLFCRLAEQGKVRVPNLSALVLNRGEQAQTQNNSRKVAQENKPFTRPRFRTPS